MRYHLPLLALITIGAFIVSLCLGEQNLHPLEVLRLLGTETEGSMEHLIVWELRLPRSLNAFAVGAMLALAGLLMQILLGNPLADPYVLGVSGGASVATLLAMLLGLYTLLIPLASLGAALSLLLLVWLARHNGQWLSERLLLTGIVLAAGWGAMINLILSIAPRDELPGMLFWLMGDLSYAPQTTLAFSLLLFGLLIAWSLAKPMNILRHGDVQAASLGVEVNKLRMILLLLGSILTAAAVSLAGNIGFIGLVTPHLLRLWGGSDHRFLIPASVLLGGSLLLGADLLSRTLIAPQQLPVGALTACIGVPLFLYLLAHRGRL